MIEKYPKLHVDNQLSRKVQNQIPNELSLWIQSNEQKLECQNSSSPNGSKYNIKVYGWLKIYELKRYLFELFKFGELVLDQIKLFYKNIQLSHHQKTLFDYQVNNGSVVVLSTRNTISSAKKGVVIPYQLFDKNNQKINSLLNNTIQAIDQGILPNLSENGSSGVYFIKNKNYQIISIFKSFDQEVNAPNNPRFKINKLGSEGIGRSKGILSGQCATREVAAYLLDDQGDNYHGVPQTTYVQFYHPIFAQKQSNSQTAQQQKFPKSITKHGSLQQYINSSGIIQNYGFGRFSVQEIHKIAILDIRILNCDRNQQNILVEQGTIKYKLIPIDHGYSLPDTLQIYEECVIWMSYPHVKQPLSQRELNFIKQISPQKDQEILASKLGFRQVCLRNLKIAEIFLKKAAALKFTLFQIGKMLYRTEKYEDQTGQLCQSKRSMIETIVMQAQNLYLNALEIIKKQNLQHQLINNQEQQQQQNGQQIDEDQIYKQKQSNESTIGSINECNSMKQILSLKRRSSLPQLSKKNTSFHQQRYKARKQRQGINGVSKTIWNKYHQEQWNQLFYYYYQNLIDTMLLQKLKTKSRKIQHHHSLTSQRC